MALIEAGPRVLGPPVAPVLRERTAIERRARKRGGIVHRFRERVFRRGRKPGAEPAANLNLSRMPRRVAVRRQIPEARRARRARVLRTGRIRVRQHLLHQICAPGTEIRAKHRQLRRKIPLHQDLPGVRGRHPEVRVYGERVERGAGRRKAVGQRERPGRAGCDVERGRQRRLLGKQRGDALIHVGAAVDAIARAYDQRVKRRAPRETHARLQSPPVGPHERVGTRVGRDERHRGEIRRHLQVCETPARFGYRHFEFPPDAVGQREPGTRRPLVSHIRRIELPAKVLVGVAVRDRTRLRQPEQEVSEIEAGGCAGEAECTARILFAGDVVQDSARSIGPDIAAPSAASSATASMV